MPPREKARQSGTVNVKAEDSYDRPLDELCEVIDREFNLEERTEVITSPDAEEAVEKKIEQGKKDLMLALRTLQTTPFSADVPKQLDITMKQSKAIRELRTAIKNQLEAPSDESKEVIARATESFKKAFAKPPLDPAEGWKPKCYRVSNPEDKKCDKNYISGIDEDGASHGDGGRDAEDEAEDEVRDEGVAELKKTSECSLPHE